TRPQYRRSTGGGVDGSRPLAAPPVRPSGRRVPVRSSSPNRAGPGARFPAVGYEWPAPPAAARCTTAGQPWFSAGTPLRLPARLLGSLDRAAIWTRFAPRPVPGASSRASRLVREGQAERRNRRARSSGTAGQLCRSLSPGGGGRRPPRLPATTFEQCPIPHRRRLSRTRYMRTTTFPAESPIRVIRSVLRSAQGLPPFEQLRDLDREVVEEVGHVAEPLTSRRVLAERAHAFEGGVAPHRDHALAFEHRRE